MSLVVERGKTRCPSCAAYADYWFAECGPDAVEYEVRCQRCGEVYREVTSTELLPFVVDTEVYVYVPYSERERAHPWLRVAATSRLAREFAAEAVASALAALGELPSRLPRPALRELEAGPRIAPA